MMKKFLLPAFLLCAAASMFLGFYRDQWGLVREKKFSLFQKGDESYVIARMVMTRQSGLLSYGGLLGWGDLDVDESEVADPQYQRQYDVYFSGGSFQSYLPKQSHPGFQGLLFSLLDRVSPFAPIENLRLFRMLNSGLLALTLTGVIAWFLRAVGFLPALMVFASIVTSAWMTLFGRNLFFVTWIFYLPLLTLLWRLEGEKEGRRLSDRGLFGLMLTLILVKCLFNGYDFILPTLGLAASPILYYAIRERWEARSVVRRLILAAAGMGLGIILSLLVLSVQNMIVSGSLQGGVQYILETFARRTLGGSSTIPALYEEAYRASTWEILKTYFSESYFGKAYFPYYAVTGLFAIASVLYLTAQKLRPGDAEERSRGMALLWTTWLSLLSPLSWYVIFKSVAYFHTHMNYLPFHMPFTLFGFALCGYTVFVIFQRVNPGRGGGKGGS